MWKIQSIPSYLRFVKFLIRLSHDGQVHTCRCCNQLGNFANECENKVCYNCDDIGHEYKDCKENIFCSIYKCPSHFARACPFSWFKASARSPRPSSPPGNDPVIDVNSATDQDSNVFQQHSPVNDDDRELAEAVISDAASADVVLNESLVSDLLEE